MAEGTVKEKIEKTTRPYRAHVLSWVRVLTLHVHSQESPPW